MRYGKIGKYTFDNDEEHKNARREDERGRRRKPEISTGTVVYLPQGAYLVRVAWSRADTMLVPSYLVHVLCTRTRYI